MMKMSNPFHLVSPSPWPIITSISLMAIAFSIIFLTGSNKISHMMIFLLTLMIMFNTFLWWRDVKREASLQGHHSFTTMKLLKLSMIMFILSEIMFFLSFFWAFFHSSITPNIDLGMKWPPFGIHTFNFMGMPLLNSMILLSSGATITWSHHSFLNKNLNQSLISMVMTIMLGISFTFFQGLEYYNAEFSFSDSVYGSTFFLATGFHGIHVMVGTLFLMTSTKSMYSLFNSSYHFISFDLSAWYWHFVDVVWLFLFASIYWWGSM